MSLYLHGVMLQLVNDFAKRQHISSHWSSSASVLVAVDTRIEFAYVDGLCIAMEDQSRIKQGLPPSRKRSQHCKSSDSGLLLGFELAKIHGYSHASKVFFVITA